MKPCFFKLFIIVSISALLSGCSNHIAEEPLNTAPSVNIETETATPQSLDLLQNRTTTERITSQDIDFLSIYDSINPSVLTDNNLSIYMKNGIPKSKGDAPMIYFLEPGDIVQLNNGERTSFIEWLGNLQLEEDHSPNYAPYLFLIKGTEDASSYLIELWPDGYIGVNWMKYYKISNNPSPQYFEDLFSKSDAVPIISYEDAFQKILPDASQMEQTTYEKNMFPTIILESGKEKYSESTTELPYLKQLWYEGYYFGETGTYYRLPLSTVYYNSDRSIFAESRIQVYHVDYITGDVTSE